MKSQEQDTKKPIISTFNEPTPDFEKAEMDLLLDGLRRTYTERFDKMMQLIKRGIMFKNARITHPGQ